MVDALARVRVDLKLIKPETATPGRGGSVLNAEGAVVGVAVGTWRQGQNLNFAVGVSEVRLLLEKAGLVLPLPLKD